MPTETCLIQESQGHLDDVIIDTRSVVLSGSAVGTDVLASTLHARLSDAAIAAGVVTFALTMQIDETANVAGRATPVGHLGAHAGETGRLHDSVRVLRAAAVDEAAALTDTLAAGRGARVHERGGVSGAWTPLRAARGVLVDAAAAADALTPTASAAMYDAAALADALASTRGGRLSSSAQTADTWAVAGAPVALLYAEGILSDALAQRVHAVAALAEEGYGVDTFLLANAGTGWTASTDSWGMSRYTDQPFNSVAVVNGVLMGANEGGVFRLDAADDAGAPIDAYIDTQVRSKKGVARMGYVYIGATSDGRMQAQATSAERGDIAASYAYPFEPRLGADFAPTRCKFGRGPQSEYWSFRVQNIAGANFTIDTMRALFEPGSRRV